MKTKRFVWINLTAMSLFAFTLAALTGASGAQGEPGPAATLVETVRRATERFQNVEEAMAAGYADFLVCVSGLEEGVMGVHFANGDLVDGGVLDPQRPEVLVYESKNRQLQLVAVEAWDANNPTTPSLLGQLFHYGSSPNRYGTPRSTSCTSEHGRIIPMACSRIGTPECRARNTYRRSQGRRRGASTGYLVLY